nr:hypothetical protein [Nostoc sp. ChiSLP03a]
MTLLISLPLWQAYASSFAGVECRCRKRSQLTLPFVEAFEQACLHLLLLQMRSQL